MVDEYYFSSVKYNMNAKFLLNFHKFPIFPMII